MKFELIDFPYFTDERGETIPFELDDSFPIIVKRVYLVTGKENETRGGHAHKTEEEVFVASSGSVTAIVNDGNGDKEILLNKKNQGLLIRKDCWHEFQNFSNDCVLMCFSSTHFAGREDYVEKKEEFLK